MEMWWEEEKVNVQSDQFGNISGVICYSGNTGFQNRKAKIDAHYVNYETVIMIQF